MLIARVSVGFMFASGAVRKVQEPEWFASTFVSAGIPFPELLSVVTAWTELILGVTLILGVLTRVSAVVLAAVMVGAAVTEIVPALLAQYPQPVRFFSNFFYSAEWLLILLLLFVALLGAGRIAGDRLIFRKQRSGSAHRR